MAHPPLKQGERHASLQGGDGEAVAQAAWAGLGTGNAGPSHGILHKPPGRCAMQAPEEWIGSGEQGGMACMPRQFDRQRWRDWYLPHAKAPPLQGPYGDDPGIELKVGPPQRKQLAHARACPEHETGEHGFLVPCGAESGEKAAAFIGIEILARTSVCVEHRWLSGLKTPSVRSRISVRPRCNISAHIVAPPNPRICSVA